MKIKTILLAEDNKFDAELTQKALSEFNLGNNLVTVGDGVEVLDYLRCEGKYKDREAGNPAVILLDIKMPRLDGIETLQTIRTDPKFKMIPVVILSSSREEQDLIRSYSLGVNGYVVKPVDFKQFVEAVRTLGVFWVLINEQPPC